MKDLNLLDIGTKVKYGAEYEYNGEITAITIRRDCVIYEITFWVDRDIKTIWLRLEQFTLNNKRKDGKLGFGNEI